MKMLVSRTPVATGLPFDHNQLKGRAFIEHSDDDALIQNLGRMAASEIEQFAQIALLNQTIRVTIFDPRQIESGTRLPIGPVASDQTPTVTIDGEAFTAFDFEGGNRPYIRWHQDYYNLIPTRITIEYLAGFGSTASDIPYDLAQAIMDQAGLLYDGRSMMDPKALSSSPHMARVGARYRGVQA